MAGLVTKETNKSVARFIDAVSNQTRREDSKTLLAMMEEITGFKPKVWGDNFIIGFGKYSYKRKSGNDKFEWFHVGFAPRKNRLTLYLTFDLTKEKALLDKLGKCKYGKGCLHINKLADVDLNVLKKLIAKSKTARWL